jgi:hypothetical protein
MLGILVSGQSYGTAKTLKEEPYRQNGSNLLEKSQNMLSRSGRLQRGENILLEYDAVLHSEINYYVSRKLSDTWLLSDSDILLVLTEASIFASSCRDNRCFRSPAEILQLPLTKPRREACAKGSICRIIVVLTSAFVFDAMAILKADLFVDWSWGQNCLVAGHAARIRDEEGSMSAVKRFCSAQGTRHSHSTAFRTQ